MGSGQLVVDLLDGSAGGLLPLGGLVPGSGVLQPQGSFPAAVQGQTVSGGSTLFVLAGGTTPSLASLATVRSPILPSGSAAARALPTGRVEVTPRPLAGAVL